MALINKLPILFLIDNYLDHILASAERTEKQQAGVLARFLSVHLNQFTSQAIADMVSEERIKRPTAVSQAYRYLRAFIRWLQDVPQFQGIVSADLYKSRQIRDGLPKAKAKNGDCLERLHLAAWFREVRAFEYAEPIKNYLADLRRISTNG